LLLLARLDQHRGLETKPVDLVDIVEEALADFAAVDPHRPLTAQLADTAVVAGDRIRLRQVIDNLLANARTHTPPRTPVHVAVRRSAGRAEIEVRDEGPGIAAEDQARVFERFWRADPARARNRGGTGLGLAIVASLVAAHDGTVDVASEPGKGTTFTVRLPLRDDDRIPRPATPVAPRAPSARTLRSRETGSRS
jgi:two-component system OmpR family sensor kinase